jgi:hypothetical protein
VRLADPGRRPMVITTSEQAPVTRNIHCELAVAAATKDGPEGALCSRTNWRKAFTNKLPKASVRRRWLAVHDSLVTPRQTTGAARGVVITVALGARPQSPL